MGVETAARAPHPAIPSPSPGDNQSAHNRVPTEDDLTTLFAEAMKRDGAGPRMAQDEQSKFLKAMGDPEFRSLLNDYMTEISDPANRAETETYLAQLEREHKVPRDKLLITPTPGFVVKSKWDNSAKIFVNICSSEKLQPPSSTKVDGGGGSGSPAGTSWSLPYSVGPERAEADKSGVPVPTFDVCFHPRTLQFATTQKPYRDMVVTTCLDAVEPLLRKSHARPRGEVSRDYHVLKGVLYKSGEPVTMCLSKHSEGSTVEDAAAPETQSMIERVETPTPSDAPMLHEKPAAKPLIQEVSTTTTTVRPTPSGDALPTLEYCVVYRGKFEMMDHMQAALPGDAAPSSRPKVLVVEIQFPTHSSAKGIDLDVNDRAVKVTAAGYAPLAVALPFAVVEEKGSATFDKKARKLVVTLPVQAPEPVAVKRMAIVEQEDEDEEEDERGGAEREKETVEEEEEEARPPAPPTATSVEDDGFAMLRETAMMVANDPLYLPREKTTTAQARVETEAAVVAPPSLEEKVRQHVARDASYDDLPPLESCSEDEDDFVDMPPEDSPATASGQLCSVPSAPSAAPRAVVRQTPPFTIKETASCRSYVVEVAGIDSASVELAFPSAASLELRFATKEAHFRLAVGDLPASIDPSRSEVDVASENMAIILFKRASSHQVAPPASIVRFQNDLLYDID